MDSNKGKKFSKGNKQSGITLVALVVTIVVLLILAGISIRLVLDNNGIINRAGDAKDKHEQGKVNDQTDLDNALDWMEEIAGPSIVEPENVDDWEYKTEDDGTLTITGYKGTETEVVIPNFINGVRVKKLYGVEGTKRSIWADEIRSENNRVWIVGSENTTAQETIEKVIISKGIEEIGAWAFVGTLKLENIEIPSSVKYIGEGAFFECRNLMEITIPDSVTAINYKTFEKCYNLTVVKIPNSITSIGNQAFNQCTSLSSITIPDSVTNLGASSFSSCISLTTIRIPDSVTSIENYAFEECAGLTSITIPESVTSIGTSAFRSCTALTTVNYTGNEEQWENITIGTNNDPLTSATIVYNYNKNV